MLSFSRLMNASGNKFRSDNTRVKSTARFFSEFFSPCLNRMARLQLSRSSPETDSRRAFITHRVSDIPGTALWDLGHLGSFGGGQQSKPLWSCAVTADQIVGQADGS